MHGCLEIVKGQKDLTGFEALIIVSAENPHFFGVPALDDRPFATFSKG